SKLRCTCPHIPRAEYLEIKLGYFARKKSSSCRSKSDDENLGKQQFRLPRNEIICYSAGDLDFRSSERQEGDVDFLW
ncbi:hypothetical protein ACFL4C_03020, partial [Candidatus Omnitrophota bacterium]